MIVVIIGMIAASLFLFRMTWRSDKTPEKQTSTGALDTSKNPEQTESLNEEKAARIKEIDAILSDPYMILVNADHGVKEDYEPEEIVTIRGMNMEKVSAEHMNKMLVAAEMAGYDDLNIYSAYRSYAKQSANFQNKIAQYKAKGYSESEAETLAAKIVNPPGKSEHQTGMAADICTEEMINHYGSLPEEFSETDTYKWLYEHCREYGFILRYPEDKEDITGITFEPWHYRYVGKENAEIIMSQKICLEEYIENLEKEKAELEKGE